MLDFIYIFFHKKIHLLCSSVRGRKQSEEKKNSLILVWDSHTMCYLAFVFIKCLLFGSIPRDVPAHLALVYATVLGDPFMTAAFFLYGLLGTLCCRAIKLLWRDNEMVKCLDIGVNCHHDCVVISPVCRRDKRLLMCVQTAITPFRGYQYPKLTLVLMNNNGVKCSCDNIKCVFNRQVMNIDE